MKRPSAVWLWSSSAYTDNTDSVRVAANFNFSSAANDVYYFGYDYRWQGFYCDLATNGVYTGVTYYYFAGDSTWKKLSLIDSYSFSASKYLRWNVPNDWASMAFSSINPQAATPIDTEARYWIKVTISTVTTTAVISKFRCIPFVEYAVAEDVSDFLQLNNKFDESTKPTDLIVENEIRKAEDRIDYATVKSFRFNASQNEIVQYNRYGVFPRRRDLLKVYSVSIWNGGSFQTLTEGRNQDYFVDYDRGMIYFTRLFLLPAAYGMTGRYYMWGFGEFAYSCQIDYVYGRDSETHPEFFVAKDLAVKIASRNLLRHTDYSKYLVSGSDKIPLSEKIRDLDTDIERSLEELKGVQIA